MGPAGTIRVEYPVAVDHFVVFVFQKWKVELTFEALLEHLREFFRVFMAVDTDGKNLDLLFLRFRQ